MASLEVSMSQSVIISGEFVRRSHFLIFFSSPVKRIGSQRLRVVMKELSPVLILTYWHIRFDLMSQIQILPVRPTVAIYVSEID